MFSSSKKYGPHIPSLAAAYHTVTLGKCYRRLFSARGLFSTQYRKFCLLTSHTSEDVPHRSRAQKYPCEHCVELPNTKLFEFLN